MIGFVRNLEQRIEAIFSDSKRLKSQRNIEGWKYAEGYRRVYFRKNYEKNKVMSFRMKIVLLVCRRLYPTDLSKFIPIPEEYLT